MGRGDLKGVIRLHKFRVDEKRRALGELLAAEAELIARLSAMDAELERERQAAQSEEAGFTFEAYYQHYRQRRAQIEGMLVELRERLDAAQDDLAESFKELKTFEISQENREKRDAAERERKEQIQLDEIAQQLHRRRHKLGRDMG